MQKEAISIDGKTVAEFTRYQQTRLLIVGLAVVIIAGGGVAAVLTGKQLVGLIMLTAELAGLVLAFFGRRNQGDDESEEHVEDDNLPVETEDN